MPPIASRRPWLIAGGKILAVGSNDEIRRAHRLVDRAGRSRGRAVTPGLLDAHAHFHSGGVQRLFVLDVSFPAVKSIEDVGRAVRAQAAKLPDGAWVKGRGWDEGKLEDRRLITARDLDRAAGDHPVYLTQTTGHYGVANSVALKMAGIAQGHARSAEWHDRRYPDGTPTGVLKESAQGLVRRLIPPRTAAESEQGHPRAREGVQRRGHDRRERSRDRQKARGTRIAASKRKARLTVRVFALWSGGTTEDAAARLIAQRGATTRPNESTGDDHLMSGGVKLFIDGSGGARTAWLHKEWNKDLRDVDTGNRGYPASDPETIRAMVLRYHVAGMHISAHAIGDRAIDWIVDSYAMALQRTPTRGLRHGIIHANIPTDRAIDVMARLQRTYDAGYPEPSATFTWWIGDTYAGNFGPGAGRASQPVRDVPNEGHSVGERIGLPGHAFSGPLRDLVRRGARAAARRTRTHAVRHESRCGRADGAARGDDLGRTTDVSRAEDRLDRGGQVRGPGRLGSGSIQRPDGPAEGHAVSDDDLQRENRLPAVRAGM